VILEPLRLVVDDDIGTKRPREFDVFGRDGCQDACALGFGKLDREVPDAAGAAVD
jgi:hypothetical protein